MGIILTPIYKLNARKDEISCSQFVSIVIAHTHQSISPATIISGQYLDVPG